MTTDPPPPPPNVAALVDAIDARARQAGNEGAAEVVQRMLGSVTEVLSSISDRLDAIEAAGAGGGVAESVQSGLAAFNARLARLEEAFVQAVDESGSGTQAVVDEVRTAVTQVLGEGTADGAAVESLRRVEASLSALIAARDERPAQEVVGVALAAMGERLDALERHVVEAVQSTTPAPVAPVVEPPDLSPLLDRLDSVERRLLETPRDVQAAVESAFEVIQVRIAGVEQLLRGRSTERVDASAAVRAAVAPVVERVDELDAAHRSTAARHNEALGRVEAALAAMPGRLTSLEERVWAVVQSLTDGSSGGVGGGAALDPTVLSRLEDAVERIDRDEASARLVKLVEERMSAGLRAVTERTEEVRRSVEALQRAVAATPPASQGVDEDALDDLIGAVRSLQSSTSTVADEVALAIGTRLAPLGDRLSGLDDRLDALVELVTSEAPATAPSAAPDLDAIVGQINDAVRREAELLTQRVAALAVGVEASRALIAQHLDDEDATFGRKAGEVTRRLAADFGIRTRRSAPGGRRDPRELGSGERETNR